MKNIPDRMNNGQIFKLAQILKKANIPFLGVSIRRDPPKTDVDCSRFYAMFTCDSWAAKKAMHPLDGVNIDFSLWDSKIRGKAQIAFRIN